MGRVANWIRDRAGVITTDEAQSQAADAAEAAANAAASHAVNEMLLANPGLAPHLRSYSGGSETHGYDPLDQDFQKYMHSTGLFAILSACDEAIATTASELPLCLKRKRRGEDEPEKVTDHPLLDIFANPNPEQGFYQWWHEGHLNNGRTGNTYLIAVSDRSPKMPFANPDELWFVSSGHMKPMYSTSAVRRGKSQPVVTGYRFDDDSIVYSPDEVLHIKQPNPDDPAVGLSPMKQLETTLNLLYRSYQSNNSYLKNGAVPGLVFRQVPGAGTSGGTQAKEGMDRFREQIELGSAGVDNTGRNIYLSRFWELLKGGGNSAADAKYIELIELLWREVLALRGVPPFAIGLLEHANWSNSTEQQAFFYNRTIIPTNRMFLDAINSHPMVLVHQAEGEKLWLEFDYSGVLALQPNVNDLWERAGAAYNLGFIKRDEARVAIGLDPVGGDVGEEFRQSPFVEVQEIIQENLGAAGLLESRQLAGEAGDNDTRRAIQWRGFEDRKRPIVKAYLRRFRPLLRKLWLDVEAAMLEASATGQLAPGDDVPVPSSWTDRVWFDSGVMFEEWRDEGSDLAESAVRSGGQDASEQITGARVPFDVTRPEVQAVIKDRAGIGIKGMLDTQQDEIKAAVEAAIRDGDTIGQLTTRIRSIGKGRNRAWAERIARTETNPLYGAGFQQSAIDLGAVSKEWLAARGGNRRPQHQAIDGQTQPIEESFEMPDGNSGQYPGAISGGGKHNANCACAANVGEPE